MKRHFIVIAACILFASCKTSSLMINVLRPAEITLPREIQSLSIVNRSLPAKEKEVDNLVEGLLTGESLLADRFGSKACIQGFADAMSSSPRFFVSVPEVSLKGTGTDRMPPLIEWDMVEEICRTSNTDALISLETFDSNTEGRVMAVLSKTPGQNLTIRVESGWRVYSPQLRQVLDESTFRDYMNWDRPIDGRGPGKQEVIERAGYYAGSQYAARISPSWISVSRIYFRKGNRDMKESKRLVRLRMFDEAARIWEQYTTHPNRKVAGYACYNMALYAEINGDLQNALEWATHAYREYRLKQAASYMNVLNRRIAQEQRLSEQLPAG